MATDTCTPQTLTAADGAQLTACAHGGHVLGWTPAGGRPRLWLSPTYECGPGLAIRGGIPVVFPQFAGRGPLPKHGVARNRGWQVQPTGSTEDGGTAAVWRAVLTDDDATRQIWPHGFELALTARAEADWLETTLSIANTGDTDWECTVALHSYLALGDPGAVIHGLGGRTAENNAAGGEPITLGAAGEALLATGKRDVAVMAAGEPLTLDDPVLGPLVVTAEGFGDRVVWNPGPEHGLADVPDGAERDFVCIEPAALAPFMIKSGNAWEGRQRLLAKGN